MLKNYSTMKKTLVIPIIAGMFLLLNACKNNNYKNATNAPPSTDTTMSTQPGNTYNTPTDSMHAMPDTTKDIANPSTESSKPMTKTEPEKTTARKPMRGKAYVSTSSMETSNMQTRIRMDKNGVYNRTAIMPSFPGGEKALDNFVQDHVQYPQDAADNNIESRVVVNFVVDKNGKIIEPTVISNKAGYGLDDEALRVVKEMPPWNPGKVKGKKVKTRMELPIDFKLEESQ
jgi:periplasmic protein TonB